MNCPNCNRAAGYPDFTTHTYTRWSNQFGSCVRIFCQTCNHVNDVREIYGEVVTVTPVAMTWNGKRWISAKIAHITK